MHILIDNRLYISVALLSLVTAEVAVLAESHTIRYLENRQKVRLFGQTHVPLVRQWDDRSRGARTDKTQFRYTI